MSRKGLFFMSTYVMYTLCIVAVVALMVISAMGSGNGSNEALRRRIESRRQGGDEGQAPATVAPIGSAASGRSTTDTVERTAA